MDSMAHELLLRGESIRFIARGRSMWPYVLDGDTVCVEPIEQQPRLGDVVLIPHPGLGRLHRIVYVSSDGRVQIRGDALVSSDGWFEPEELGGRLSFIIRNGRRIEPSIGMKTVVFARVLAYARRVVSLLR